MSLQNKPTLSPKQEEFIQNSVAKINIAHGAVRSGKTFATLIRFAELALTCPDNAIYIVGNSLSAIEDNAVKVLDGQLFKGYCSWSKHKHKLTLFDKEITIIGANDESAVRRIQGNTMSLVYVDEMSILPLNFLDMLYSRLSKPHSRLIGTTNPDTPHHPLKRVIDESDGKRSYALHFDLDDNPYLPKNYRDMIEHMYAGLWYKRFVLGQWVMAEGAIYDFFDRKTHVIPRPPTGAQFYFAGLDIGSANPTACVVIGYNRDVRPCMWVEKEYYWDPRVQGRQKTHAELADDIQDMLDPYGLVQIYIDPSAEAMHLELRKRHLRVMHANNDVYNGIGTVATLMADQNLMICTPCTNLIKEMEGYVWDAKKIKLGEDAPLKVNDHGVDALRYAVHTRWGDKKTLHWKSPDEYAYQAEKERVKQMRMRRDQHGPGNPPMFRR